ncbi:MAG: hypothetical protein WEA61_07685 [Anaerolineales bacterium]
MSQIDQHDVVATLGESNFVPAGRATRSTGIVVMISFSAPGGRHDPHIVSSARRRAHARVDFSSAPGLRRGP